MKTRELNVRYVLIDNKESEGKDLKPVHLSISYDRKSTKFKSLVFDLVDIKEIDKLKDTPEGKSEKAMIESALAVETSNFVDRLLTFKGFSPKLKFYLKPIVEVFNDYGVACMKHSLIDGFPAMQSEERALIGDLEDLMPFPKYLCEDGDYFQKVIHKPQVLMNIVKSFLKEREIKSGFKVLSELVENIEDYMLLWNCLQDFMRSDFLPNKNEAVVINWLNGTLMDRFEDYLKGQRKDGTRYSDISVEQITIGLWYSSPFKDVFQKAEKFRKI